MSSPPRQAGAAPDQGDAAHVTVATTTAELDRLRPIWSRLPVADVDADLDYFRAMVAANPAARPHVLLLERPGLAPILAVMRLEHQPLPIKVGYQVVARPRVRRLVMAFGGAVGLQTEADALLLVERIRAALSDGEADFAVLPKRPQDDPLLIAARRTQTGILTDRSSTPVQRWTAPIPDDYDALLATRSSKARQQLRQYARRLEKKYGDELRLNRYQDPSDLDRICRDLDTVAAKTYQRRLGAGFRDDELHRAQVELGLRMGWLRAWVRALAGQPIAFWYGIGYRGVFSTDTPGFDPAYADDRVGTYTMMRMAEDLCRDPGIHSVDFGHGDAEYKRTFGATPQLEVDVVLTAARPKAVAVAFTTTAAAKATRAGKRLLGDSGRLQQAKKLWRSRLVGPGQG